MRRTDVVVPAHLVDSLRVPDLAVTTGEASVEWVAVPTSAWRFRRRPSLRLPLDPRSARRARRYVRSTPWYALVVLLPFLGWTAVIVADVPLPVLGPATASLVSCLALCAWSLPSVGGALPRQTPYRTGSGDLRIPGVPVDVARRWTDANVGVTVTDEPAPRRHSPFFYALLACGLVGAGIAVGSFAVKDSRPDSVLLWMAVAILVISGASAALKVLPPGYVRLDHPDVE